MDLFKARYPERAMREKEEATAVLNLSEYTAYVASDGSDYWSVTFLKNGEYVASGICSESIGSCIEYMLADKNNLISLLNAGNFL